MKHEQMPSRASEWLVALLERSDDDALRARFEVWLAANPEHAADWAEIAHTYELLARTAPAHQGRWAPYAARRRGRRTIPETPAARQKAAAGPVARFRSRRTALGLARAALVAAVAWFALPDLALRIAADHMTATGQTRTIALRDGSTVRLGPESAISIAEDGEQRQVELLRGGAFFEVTHDPDRPFRVTASLVHTTVLGTAFEVRLDESGADVAVRNGVVQVASRAAGRSAAQRLEAGDWLRMAWNGDFVRGKRPPEQVAAWLGGQLIAKDRPVGEVVDQLRRYYRGIIILQGATLARQPLTGVYSLSDPIAALKAVASAQHATVYQISPWVTVLSGR